MSDGRRRYRFGPVEHRGLIGGLGVVQLTALLAGGAATLGLLATARSAFGVLAAFLTAGVTAGLVFWPVNGRAVIEWTPVLAGFQSRSRTGRTSWRSGQPTRGATLTAGQIAPAVGEAPETLTGIALLSVPFRGQTVGVIHDRGDGSLLAILGVRVGSFALLSGSDQEQRLAGWGGVLAALSREGSPVCRVQWIERTSPGTGDEVNRHFATAWDQDSAAADSFPVRAYVELIAGAPAVTRDHELLLAIKIDPKRVPRQKRPRAKDWTTTGCELLLREVAFLAERLSQADVEIAGVLRPDGVARALRLGFDPWDRPTTTTDPAGERDGVAGLVWPSAAEEAWSTYRTGGAVHATFWVSGWPRMDVGATFLAPLLLQGDVTRTVAMTIAPVPPGEAIRRAEADRTADAADRHVRARMGFLTSARHRRTEDAASRREEELADGHAALRFAAFVTVTAKDGEELDRSCTLIEHAASMARLDLRRIHGEQAHALTYTLPLGKGIT